MNFNKKENLINPAFLLNKNRFSDYVDVVHMKICEKESSLKERNDDIYFSLYFPLPFLQNRRRVRSRVARFWVTCRRRRRNLGVLRDVCIISFNEAHFFIQIFR